MATYPLIVIVGETASGKSKLAIDLASNFNGEIISADSWAIRKELNIGTAKPAASEQAKVRHHLIDVVEPCADFTAAVFKELALTAIDDIHRRGKIPIMVGGSGLYVDGVIYNFNFLKEGEPAQRALYNKLTVAQLLKRAEKAGYDLTGIDLRNKRRLVRLLETKGARATKQELRPNTLIVGIKQTRAQLKRRVEARVEKMLKLGLEAEVKGLAEQYGWQCEGLKGIGYSQWKDYLAGSQTLGETKQKIIKATLELAKRQRTWFKRNKSIQWTDTPKKAVEIVTTFLSKKQA